MDALTVKTTEIRRLHAVCRAKDAAVRQVYLGQIKAARLYQHRALHSKRERRKCDNLGLKDEAHESLRAYGLYIDLRNACLYAARVVKEILKELEG